MALSIPYLDDETGVHTDACYVRVEGAIIDIVDEKIILVLVYYWDAAAATDGKKPLKTVQHVVPDARVRDVYIPAVKSQAYGYLTTFVPEFAGAASV
jgi:hypothetical protein